MTGRGRNVWAVEWDADGNVTKTTSTYPGVGVRAYLVEAKADQAPKGEHYDGAPASIDVSLYDSSVRKDSSS